MKSLILRSHHISTPALNSNVGMVDEIGVAARVNLERVCWYCRFRRQGAAAVEFALVAPLFFLVVLGMVEIGRAIMVMQIVTNAAREGARFAVIDGPIDQTTGKSTTTATAVQTWTKNYMSNAALPSSAATVTVSPEPSTAADGAQITVTVTIPYSAVSWLPTAQFLSGKSLSAKVVMRRETVQ
jgi:Flp pilus assembly protein TadG